MARFTRENAAAFGSRGGKTTQQRGVCSTRITSERGRDMGRKGGAATRDRYGRGHFQAIGARGFAATVERHHAGDAWAYLQELREKGLIVTADREFALMVDSGLLDHLIGER